MENKYYELITELVKNHRKYQGLEAILEDIVLDVQERAKVVLNNVTNAEIVESYLTKIVSTSIITVPKKLNYDTKVRHRVINNENIYKELEQDIEKTKDDFFDIATESSEEVIANEQENLEEISEDVVEEIDTFEEIITDENINAEENDANTKNNDIDISLVDKMINGISSDEEDFEAENSDDDIIELEEIDSIELDENNDIQEEIVEQDEKLIEVQDELIDEDNELIEVQDELIEENDELIEVQDELIDENDELIEVQDELIEEKVTAVNKSDKYSVFEYEPDEIEIFQDEIITSLKELDYKKPESNILKIIELKYKQNLSIEEIAKVLDINVEQILEVLYEIIEIIKD